MRPPPVGGAWGKRNGASVVCCAAMPATTSPTFSAAPFAGMVWDTGASQGVMGEVEVYHDAVNVSVTLALYK